MEALLHGQGRMFREVFEKACLWLSLYSRKCACWRMAARFEAHRDQPPFLEARGIENRVVYCYYALGIQLKVRENRLQ